MSCKRIRTSTLTLFAYQKCHGIELCIKVDTGLHWLPWWTGTHATHGRYLCTALCHNIFDMQKARVLKFLAVYKTCTEFTSPVCRLSLSAVPLGLHIMQLGPFTYDIYKLFGTLDPLPLSVSLSWSRNLSYHDPNPTQCGHHMWRSPCNKLGSSHSLRLSASRQCIGNFPPH